MYNATLTVIHKSHNLIQSQIISYQYVDFVAEIQKFLPATPSCLKVQLTS